MSLTRELILHPEYFEDALRTQCKRFAQQKLHGGWTQFYHRVYRPGIGHDLHVAGKSKKELSNFMAIAKRIFKEVVGGERRVTEEEAASAAPKA